MTRSVLLCDDEEHVLRAAEYKLSRHGFEVVLARDGAEGLTKALERRPDMIVTDFQMPKRSGIELAAAVRAEPTICHTPIIMLTGRGFEIRLSDIRQEYGILGLLPKPFSPSELLRTIERLLSEQAPSPEGATQPLAPLTK